MAGDNLARTLSRPSLSRRASLSFSSSSKNSWTSIHLGEISSDPTNVFENNEREDDEEELTWAAIERLPTYDRMRKGRLKHVSDNGKVNYEEFDAVNLGIRNKILIMESLLKIIEEDNEKLLRKIRDRIDRFEFSLFLFL